MIATIKGVQKNEMPTITALVYRFGGKVIRRTVPLNKLGTDKGQVEVKISGEDEVNGFDIAVCDLGYDVKWDDESHKSKPVSKPLHGVTTTKPHKPKPAKTEKVQRQKTRKQAADKARLHTPFKYIKVPGNRHCHSCERLISKGQPCIAYSRSSQSALNVCPQCIEYLATKIKKGKEDFTFEVSNSVEPIDTIVRKNGLILIQSDVVGIIKERLSGDRYKVEFVRYREWRAPKKGAGTYVTIMHPIIAIQPGRNLSRV